MKGQLLRVAVPAPALSGNPLNDPLERTTPVYLPPGYDERGTARYPVVYFLHGSMGDALGWTHGSPFQLNVPDRVDALISEQKVPPLIAVFVDGFTSLGGTQWIDSAATGRYGEYLCKDVVDFVDQRFGTVATAAGRALVGKSSGGYGVLATVRDRPDRFGHVACHSGDAYFEYAYLPEFPKAVGPLTKAGGVEPWYADFRARAKATKMRGDDFAVINLLGLCSCYSPNLAAPLFVDLPFELRTGRLREDVWQRWLAQDPVRFLPGCLPRFKQLSSVFVDCGSRDEFFLQYGARMVGDLLKQGGVGVTYEEFDDGHRGTGYRYERSLLHFGPKLARG